MNVVGHPFRLARLVSAFFCVFVALFGLPATASAQTGAVQIEPDAMIDLWPNTAPGAPNPLPKEEIVFQNNPFNLIDRAAHFHEDRMAEFAHVDGVAAFTHTTGCGTASTG
uniref:hypothetical protein n=1 Tax=Aquidulcibacter sp. TaxID=2052990 RepID=UPI0037BFE3E3